MVVILALHHQWFCPSQTAGVHVQPDTQGNKIRDFPPGLSKRHVSNLLLFVPAEEQETVREEDDVEVENVCFEDDVEEESTVLDEDDVCDAMAPSGSSSCNSTDAKKQNETAALQEGEVDAEPGGMLPQDVAVLNLGTPMHKSLLFLKPMVNISCTVAHFLAN